MQQSNNIKIEVAYAIPDKQIVLPLIISEGTSVIDAIKQSQIHLEFQELDISNPANLNVGIFGKKIDISNYILKNNDRIEIYRKLNKTPNQKRLERAKPN